jgi:hypothetical protein
MTSTLRTLRTFTASLLSGTKWHSPSCQRCGYASDSSSKRWLNRQSRDPFSKQAKVQQLKSRAAFKLLEIHDEYKIFRKGQTVVDLVPPPLLTLLSDQRQRQRLNRGMMG